MRNASVSVVVPVYEEAGNLSELCRSVSRALSEVPDIRYEIILVDDGSQDSSWNLIRQLHQQDERVKAVRLTRNFGHQSALTAGYRHAAGDAVITMDGDLQHPPSLLPGMIERWREGYDVVSMVRETSPHDGQFKSWSSQIFYKLINVLSDVTIKNAVADFRLLDRRVVRRLNSLTERGRFIRGLISWVGFSETELRYTASPRFAGRTKYSLRTMLRLAANAVSSFSTVPLRLSFYLGLAVNALCLVLMGYAIYNKIYEHKDLSEWASTFMTMLFLHGIQLLMLGIIGVYLGRVFEEVKRRPLYIASEKLGFPPGRGRLTPGAASRPPSEISSESRRTSAAAAGAVLVPEQTAPL